MVAYSEFVSSYWANLRNTCSRVVWLKLYSSMSKSILAETRNGHFENTFIHINSTNLVRGWWSIWPKKAQTIAEHWTLIYRRNFLTVSLLGRDSLQILSIRCLYPQLSWSVCYHHPSVWFLDGNQHRTNSSGVAWGLNTWKYEYSNKLCRKNCSATTFDLPN